MANANFIVQNGITVGGQGGGQISTDPTTGALVIAPAPTAANANPVAVVISTSGTVSTVATTGGVPSSSAVGTVANAASATSLTTLANVTITGNLLVQGVATYTSTETVLGIEVVAGNLVANSGTASSSTTTGALVVAGGAGISGALNVGGASAITGAATIGSTLGVTGVATLAGNVVISSATETVSTSTGALVVAGGASITGNAYVGNNLYIGSTAFNKNLTTPTIIAVDNGSNYAQIGMINTSGNGSADFAAYADNGTDAAGWVDMGIAGSTFSDGNYTITKPNDGYLITRPFSNSYGGNLVIGTSEAGFQNDIVIGVGSFSTTAEVARFHGNVGSNGTFTIKYPTVASSTTTGALVVTGGIASGGDLRIAGNIYAASLNTVSSSQLSVTAPLVYLTGNPYPYTYDIGMYSHFIGGSANTYGHTGAVRSYQNNYWGFFSNVQSEPSGTVNWTDAGLIWDTVKAGALIIANATASTTTTTGALTVAGGVGVAKSVNIGGDGTNAIVHTGHIVPSANLSYNLGSSTAWYSTFYGKATQAQYADLAENYQADSNYSFGTVLMFGGQAEVTVATADTTRVAGVVSQNPAHLMNGGLTGANVVPLALQGRVPCNIIGPVAKGDLMVSAGFGFAKANNNAGVGQVIGKALADFPSATKGQIEVVVGRF